VHRLRIACHALEIIERAFSYLLHFRLQTDDDHRIPLFTAVARTTKWCEKIRSRRTTWIGPITTPLLQTVWKRIAEGSKKRENLDWTRIRWSWQRWRMFKTYVNAPLTGLHKNHRSTVSKKWIFTQVVARPT